MKEDIENTPEPNVSIPRASSLQIAPRQSRARMADDMKWGRSESLQKTGEKQRQLGADLNPIKQSA
jgi:hypothetical protein